MVKMTIIRFPRVVDIATYYDDILEKLMAFLRSNDYELYVDLQTTNLIYPDVLCIFLSYLKFQHIVKGARVHLIFGGSTSLSSFLDNAGFFLHAEVQTVFTYDYITGSSLNRYKEANTNKINRFNVPNYTYYSENQKMAIPIPNSIRASVQKQVLALYSNKAKEKNMREISDEGEILPGLMEIVENAYKHSYDFPNSCCYYTFQSYKNAGFTFACSDIGPGLYESFEKKLFDPEETIFPRIFTEEEYEELKTDQRKRDLASIFECITYRIREFYPIGDFGFPFILRKLIIQKNGQLTIRNGHITLSIDAAFANSLFTLKNDYIIGFDKQKIRALVFNISNHYKQNGHIKIYADSFPGVHVSVHIPVGGGNK